MLKPDLLEIVQSQGIKLKKRGNSFWALCPFHSEKTPSFNVNEEKQVFYCFGCQKGGDVVNFIMNLKKLSLTEALKYLGCPNDRLNITNNLETRKREVVKAFDQWCRNRRNELLDDFRVISKTTNYMGASTDLIEYGDIIKDLSIMNYQLDILDFGTEEEKFKLFQEWEGGRKF